MKTSQHKYCADIKPIDVYVKTQYLRNFDEMPMLYKPGQIKSVWSYPGHEPTFSVVLNDGTIFSYLPVSAFNPTVSTTASPENHQPCGMLCPSENFILFETKLLKDKVVYCYSPQRGYLGIGKYQFSIEWPNENECVHLMKLNGSLRLVPNHKMLVFDREQETIPALPLTWKKLRKEWTVK
jgi:hypothetical protein